MFNKNVGALIFFLFINGIVDLFIYTFFTAYMLKISGNSIIFISKFYILVYIATGIGFVSLLPLIKRLKKTIILRAGAILKAVFILLVVLLGEKIIAHYIWLGILYGFFEAVFLSGANAIKNKVVESDKLKNLISVINVNSKIVSIVCPILFGISIDAWHFEKIAIVILALMSVQIIVSFLIKQKEEDEEKKASIKAFLNAVKENEQKKIINKTFLVLFLRGLQCAFPTLLIYLIICCYGTNTSLGILTTIGSILSIFSVIIFNAIKNADRKIWLYIVFAVLESVSLILAVIFINKIFIVIFQIISVCVTIIVNSMSEAMRGSSIRDANLSKFLPEAIAVGEIYLVLGCVLSFVILLIIGVCNSFVVTLVLSGVFCICIFLYCIFLGILKSEDKKLRDIQKEEQIS